jgi:hypothetical protein
MRRRSGVGIGIGYQSVSLCTDNVWVSFSYEDINALEWSALADAAWECTALTGGSMNQI